MDPKKSCKLRGINISAKLQICNKKINSASSASLVLELVVEKYPFDSRLPYTLFKGLHIKTVLTFSSVREGAIFLQHAELLSTQA